MIKNVDPISDNQLNEYINSLEDRKSNKSKELIKINEEFREIDQKLKDALEVRELRLSNKGREAGCSLCKKNKI